MKTITVVVNPIDPPSFKVTLTAETWTLSELKNKIPAEKFDVGNWVIGLAEAEDIIWNDSNTAARNKIQEKRVITQILRAKGGSDLYLELIGEAIGTIDRRYKRIADCSVCWESKECISLHADTCAACLQCLQSHFSTADSLLNNTIRCLCSKTQELSPASLVQRGVDNALVKWLDALNESRKCCRLMQWQKHKCGSLIKLTNTKYSQQKCNACKQNFCFFCNADWTPDRNNQELTCGNNCLYQSMLTVKMVPWDYAGPGKRIPAFRYCPNCVSLVAYAGKCKNHQCPECQLWFCFFCLQNSSDAGHNYKQECPVKTLTLEDLYTASIKFESSMKNK